MTIPPAHLAAVRARLLAWYDRAHRALPWRSEGSRPDPYRVWVAEVMLQQTQVATAIPYYLRFLERFPTLAALAAAEEGDVLAAWSGLGYYARARRLPAAAREALARHGGLPRAASELRALPGFGPYTAGAVASIAFGAREPCVDGNVARVLARVFLVEGDPAGRAVRERLWALAAALVPPRRPGDFNQALMELGATVCGRASPACPRCPVARRCAARRDGRERELPRARRRAIPARLDVACAVLWRRGSLLLERSAPAGLFGGLWGLPGAAVPPGGDARSTLRAALTARLGVEVEIGEELASVRRVLTHRLLGLTAFGGRVRSWPRRAVPLRRVAPDRLAEVGVSTAMQRLIERLPGEPASDAGEIPPARVRQA